MPVVVVVVTVVPVLPLEPVMPCVVLVVPVVPSVVLPAVVAPELALLVPSLVGWLQPSAATDAANTTSKRRRIFETPGVPLGVAKAAEASSCQKWDGPTLELRAGRWGLPLSGAQRSTTSKR